MREQVAVHQRRRTAPLKNRSLHEAKRSDNYSANINVSFSLNMASTSGLTLLLCHHILKATAVLLPAWRGSRERGGVHLIPFEDAHFYTLDL